MSKLPTILLASSVPKYTNPRLRCSNVVLDQETGGLYETKTTPPMYVVPAYKNWPHQYQLTEWCSRDTTTAESTPIDHSILNNPTDIIFPRSYNDIEYKYRTAPGISIDDNVYIVGIVDDEYSQSIAVPIESYSITLITETIAHHSKITTNLPCNVLCEVAPSCPSYGELQNSSFLRQTNVEQMDWGYPIIWRFGTISAFLEGCDQSCSADMYHSLWQSCFVGDTRVLLADNTFKPARCLTINDVVMCWNFDEGKMEASDLLWLSKKQTTQSYNKIITNTGRVFGNVNNHRLFSLTTNKFERCLDMLNHDVWTLNGPEKIVNIQTSVNNVEYYNAISSKHMNIITEGFLSSCGHNNLYPIQDMQYIKESRQYRPIDVYGDIPQQWYQTLRLSEHYCDPDTVKPYIEKCLSNAQ